MPPTQGFNGFHGTHYEYILAVYTLYNARVISSPEGLRYAKTWCHHAPPPPLRPSPTRPSGTTVLTYALPTCTYTSPIYQIFGADLQNTPGSPASRYTLICDIPFLLTPPYVEAQIDARCFLSYAINNGLQTSPCSTMPHT
jgi:hypothetical protein